MSTTTWEMLSKEAESLSPTDQLRLAEQLTRRTRAYFERTQPTTKAVEYDDIAEMARDPEIQRELRAIQADFAGTESDGIYSEVHGV